MADIMQKLRRFSRPSGKIFISFDAGVRDLNRTTEADGVFCYTFFKGVGRTAVFSGTKPVCVSSAA